MLQFYHSALDVAPESQRQVGKQEEDYEETELNTEPAPLGNAAQGVEVQDGHPLELLQAREEGVSGKKIRCRVSCHCPPQSGVDFTVCH